MLISIIAAKADNRAIGYKNVLPWRLPADLKYFKQKTMGHHVAMGRRTFESLPGSLIGRKLIILSQDPSYNVPEGCIIASGLNEAVKIAQQNGEQELFIAGGGQIYQSALYIADRMYITEVHASPIGDTFFPNFSESAWKEISRQTYAPDAHNPYAYAFVVYDRQ